MEGTEDSPLTKMGVPAQAVPVVATVATAGVMAIWPFITKTVMGLLKTIFASLIKNRAKKTRKVDKAPRVLLVLGYRLRPIELGSLLVAAVVYGLAVTYAFQGKNLKPSFLAGQESLVLLIYYSRSIVRFTYERFFKLATQYKFWAGGAFLCLGSAYLGNALSTVGFEVEATMSKEDAERIVRMKAWLIVLAVAMAIGFGVANLHAPTKILQSGRVMMSGMALGEILPVNPMPGLKIFKWRPGIWALLFAVVVPTFVLLNLVL